jgi:hypothetical protein
MTSDELIKLSLTSNYTSCSLEIFGEVLKKYILSLHFWHYGKFLNTVDAA